MPLIFILMFLFVIVIVAIVVNKVFTSKRIDDFANKFCRMTPEKSTEELCEDGKQVFDTLDAKASSNTKKQDELEEENDEISAFKKDIVTQSQIDEDLEG